MRPQLGHRAINATAVTAASAKRRRRINGWSGSILERENTTQATPEEESTGIIDVPPVGNSPDQIYPKIDINVLYEKSLVSQLRELSLSWSGRDSVEGEGLFFLPLNTIGSNISKVDSVGSITPLRYGFAFKVSSGILFIHLKVLRLRFGLKEAVVFMQSDLLLLYTNRIFQYLC